MVLVIPPSVIVSVVVFLETLGLLAVIVVDCWR